MNPNPSPNNPNPDSSESLSDDESSDDGSEFPYAIGTDVAKYFGDDIYKGEIRFVHIVNKNGRNK